MFGEYILTLIKMLSFSSILDYCNVGYSTPIRTDSYEDEYAGRTTKDVTAAFLQCMSLLVCDSVYKPPEPPKKKRGKIYILQTEI